MREPRTVFPLAALPQGGYRVAANRATREPEPLQRVKMSDRRLNVFSPTSATTPANEAAGEPQVNVSVAELVPLLVDAFQTDRTWLRDFGRDSVRVSSDLYEVLLAYQQLRRCEAA